MSPTLNGSSAIRRFEGNDAIEIHDGITDFYMGLPHMYNYIRESVDSLCRDGADAQYMQYLSKSHITSPQTC